MIGFQEIWSKSGVEGKCSMTTGTSYKGGGTGNYEYKSGSFIELHTVS